MIARIPTLEPIACPCHGEPYRVREEGGGLVARCPGGEPWGGVPTARTRPIPPSPGTHRAPVARVSRIPGRCKGCPTELPPTGGRPREWCDACAPPARRAGRAKYAKKIAARGAPT